MKHILELIDTVDKMSEAMEVTFDDESEFDRGELLGFTRGAVFFRNKLKGLLEAEKTEVDKTIFASKKYTRIEVIDKNGRSYQNFNCDMIEAQQQDNSRTLKLFVKEK